MGMSASQARYLNLVARQNDLEFQGQQINQSRTTLSDQTNNLYSQLQNLDVPTPPVTNDYTKIVYSTSDGAVNYTLGTVRPSTKKEGAYNLDLKFQTVGDSVQKSVTASSISYSDADLYVTEVKPTYSGTGDFVGAIAEGKTPEFYIADTSVPTKGSDLPADADPSDYVKVDGGNFVSAGDTIDPDAMYIKKTTVDEYEAMDETGKADCNGYVEEQAQDAVILNESQLSSYYVLDAGEVIQLTADCAYAKDQGDGTYKIELPAGAKLFEEGGTDTIKNPNPNQLLIGGNTALTYTEAFAEYKDKISWNDYEKGIQNTFGKDAKLEDFYFVITPSKTGNGTYDVKLFRKEDIPTTAGATQGMTANAYTYETGTYTEVENKDYVELEFDSSGRISKITIPTEYDANGNPVAWKKLDVASKSETDNEAYEQAMTKYEYAKFQYDREQTEINAQMSIIQSQDKKLELKLQRLDNERTQITTELDALKKVIGDSTERGYKTFSG